MADEPYTAYMYFTTNGSLPTLASRHYGVTVRHGCRDPLLNSPGPLIKNRSASPAKAVFVEWNLVAVGIYVWPRTPVRVVRTLFVAMSGGKVLGAMRIRFTYLPVSIGGKSYPPDIVSRLDMGRVLSRAGTDSAVPARSDGLRGRSTRTRRLRHSDRSGRS
jgi:hypothetical protein